MICTIAFKNNKIERIFGSEKCYIPLRICEVFHKKVYAIGAGLTAAYKLLKQCSDYEVIVLEERGDMGGHRFFSKVSEVNEWWNRIILLFYSDRR